MSARLKSADARSTLVGVSDALTVEVVPMLDALHVLARYAGALREVEAVAESEPSFGRRLALGGVDLRALMDQQPEDRIAELAWAIGLRVRQLAKGDRDE